MKHTFYIVLFFISISAESQQSPAFVNYRYTMTSINPAYTTSQNVFEGYLLFRNQWSGVQDSPKMQSFGIAGKLGDKMGLGVSVVNTNVFILKETQVYMDASYQLMLDNDFTLHLGLKIGGSLLNINFNSLESSNNDPSFNSNVDRFNFNAGAGLLLKKEQHYMHFSVPRLIQNDRTDDSEIQTNLNSASDELLCYFGAGTIFSITEKLQLHPSTLVRLSPDIPLSIDITTSLIYQKILELGANYRYDSSFGFLLGLHLSELLTFSYAYETSNTGVLGNSSHEFLIRLEVDSFKSKKDKKAKKR